MFKINNKGIYCFVFQIHCDAPGIHDSLCIVPDEVGHNVCDGVASFKPKLLLLTKTEHYKFHCSAEEGLAAHVRVWSLH